MVADYECVAQLSDLSADGRVSVLVDDVPVLLIRSGDLIFAIEDVCSHDGQPLTDGAISHGQITCARHGARFELASGKAVCMPATTGIRVYSVELRGDDLYCRESDGPVSPLSLATGSTAPVSTETVLPGASLPTMTDATASGCCGGGHHAAGEMPIATACSAEPVNSSRSLDEKMIDALKQVIDPELMINVVDLGLVYSINYDGKKAFVDMTLTSPMCPAGPQIVQQSKMALERLREVDEAVIKLVMTPPWSPDRMTEEARDQLGIF